MMENAVYSVISPEGCASILWRSADYAREAADALKITSKDLLRLGVIDAIIPEPLGAAHRNREDTIKRVGDGIDQALGEIEELDGTILLSQRRERFITLGNDALSS
jgi:acetyl-CoA carboxylase carboxyl transferase subunit alpha